jgi:3-hydroxyisobutyrate dehydrogenase
MTTVGVVGVGRMGMPLVQRLAVAGQDVLATDIDERRRGVPLPSGAQWRSTTRDLIGECDALVTVLPGGPELASWMHDGAPLDHLRPGTVWVDHTSASAELGRGAAALAAAAGVAFVGAPIGGGVAAMRAGEVTLFAGGDADALAAAKPVVECYATRIDHVGDAGAGYLVKLLVNALWFGQVAMTTEALLLARHHGVAPATMQRALAGSAGDSSFARQHLPALLSGDYLADFGLDRCVEELNAVELTAAQAGVPHPVTTAVVEEHRAALEHFGPVAGELMVAAWLEQQTGSALHRS